MTCGQLPPAPVVTDLRVTDPSRTSDRHPPGPSHRPSRRRSTVSEHPDKAE
jgi:hypothetical protein